MCEEAVPNLQRQCSHRQRISLLLQARRFLLLQTMNSKFLRLYLDAGVDELLKVSTKDLGRVRLRAGVFPLQEGLPHVRGMIPMWSSGTTLLLCA